MKKNSIIKTIVLGLALSFSASAFAGLTHPDDQLPAKDPSQCVDGKAVTQTVCTMTRLNNGTIVIEVGSFRLPALQADVALNYYEQSVKNCSCLPGGLLN